MASILTAATAAASSDFSITTETTTLLMTGTKTELATLDIEVKDSASVYTVIGTLTPAVPIQVLSGPGTYRVTRKAGGPSIGCDRN